MKTRSEPPGNFLLSEI